MRKLKLQVQVSIDGFIAGPNGEMDWMVWNWDEELKSYVKEITGTVDCIIMGRKLAEGFIPYWATVAENPDDPQYNFGLTMKDTHKLVFSKSPGPSSWHNTRVTAGDLVEVITELKNQNGKDIIVYGGGSFVSSLIKAGLIDEYHLFINPTAIGDGMTIFKRLTNKQPFNLLKSLAFACGIVVNCYEPNRA